MSQARVLSHLNKVGSISIREAMDDYGLSGGSLTKIISRLKRSGHTIVKEMRKHPITGRRYARYYMAPQVGDTVRIIGSTGHRLMDKSLGVIIGRGMDGIYIVSGLMNDGSTITQYLYRREFTV